LAASCSARVRVFAFGLVLIWLAVFSAGCDSVKPAVTVKYYYTQTDDGKTLSLRRYRPQRLQAHNNPVMLCHGLSYNLLFWDLAAEVSLPRYLARAGYDVWSLSLRGACPSSQPPGNYLRKLVHFNLDAEALVTLKRRLGDVRMLDWSVDDHINYDVPAALAFVRSKTGFERVHWVGHSMGAMIIFAHLGQDNAEAAGQVKSFVAIAAPMVVFHPPNEPMKRMLQVEATLRVGSKVVGSSVPATWGAILGDTGTELDRLFFHRDNMSPAVRRELFRVAQEEISPGQLRQLLNMVRTERFHSLDSSIDYTTRLARVLTPTCFFAGTVDNMATPGAVRYAYREIGAQDKEFHLFGRVNGQRSDYGHDDLVIGRHARQEIYPVVLNWLSHHPRQTDESRFMLQPADGPKN